MKTNFYTIHNIRFDNRVEKKLAQKIASAHKLQEANLIKKPSKNVLSRLEHSCIGSSSPYTTSPLTPDAVFAGIPIPEIVERRKQKGRLGTGLKLSLNSVGIKAKEEGQPTITIKTTDEKALEDFKSFLTELLEKNELDEKGLVSCTFLYTPELNKSSNVEMPPLCQVSGFQDFDLEFYLPNNLMNRIVLKSKVDSFPVDDMKARSEHNAPGGVKFDQELKCVIDANGFSYVLDEGMS